MSKPTLVLLWALVLTLSACADPADSLDGATDAAGDAPHAQRDAGGAGPQADTGTDVSARDVVADQGDDAHDGNDSAPPDAPQDSTPPYGWIAPPDGELSPVLASQTWRTHFAEDILPYWTHPDALGDPMGNFPTHRGMDGAAQTPSTRRPRMIARQIHTYVVGYLLTGDPDLLEYAGAGFDWLLEHAFEPSTGTCVAQLSSDGAPLRSEARTAQDQAYCALGFASWFFLTRDPAAEAALLAIRDSLFDEAEYWDGEEGRIRDALTDDLRDEVDVDGDDGWELVAQLDAVNAFLLLVQPVLTEPARRAQLLGDLRVLGQVMVDHFHQDGTFWGVHNQRGVFGSRHADFGHGLKTFWMLLQIDKRLPEHPFKALLDAEMGPAIDRAYDPQFGRWAKRPASATTVEYGSDWWIYAEADQAAATWNLRNHARTRELERTWAGWRRDYVDRGRDVREVVPSIDREGRWVWDWTDDDTAKCNAWKNGFHAAEHALVGTLVGGHLGKEPVALHFAPVSSAAEPAMRPYVFEGSVDTREVSDVVQVRGRELRPTLVTFRQIW